MDREPPDGARRRWMATELVPEQLAQTVCHRRILLGQDGIPPLWRRRQANKALPGERMQNA